MRPNLAIIIEGLPPLQGNNPEILLTHALCRVPGIMLLSPVQFLINANEPAGRVYGVFASGKPRTGLAHTIVDCIRIDISDSDHRMVRVEVIDMSAANVYDQRECK